MDTLALDQFTQAIARLYAQAERLEVEPRQSYKGHARRLEKKRDNLSLILFQVPYAQAVREGKYEPW